MIYLDHAAATPVSDAVLAAMRPYFQDHFYNPSATYLAARSVRKDLEKARESVAMQLGARPSEIVFTAGGTEADNLAISGVMERYPGANAVVSAIEHDAVLQSVERYNHVAVVPVSPDGEVSLLALKKTVDDKTVLVSVLYANNEVGTVQPIKTISRYLHEVRQNRKKSGNPLPLYFHTDASQAPNYLDVHVSRLGVDMMTLNGGKIYGPKQSGVLYVHSGVQIDPLIHGGGQERGLRSGTENVPAAIGFATALAETQKLRDSESVRLRELQQLMINELRASFPDAKFNSGKHRLPNFVHITVPGWDNERIVMELDERGVQCAVGSACGVSDDEPSHVLRAMGLSRQEAQESVRFTLGRSTTKKAIETTIAALKEITLH